MQLALIGTALAAAVLAASALRAAPPHMFVSRGRVDPRVLIGHVLASHNHERGRVGAPPLAWDPTLAAGAQHYANQLARLHVMRHSPKTMRPGTGEHLWMGTRNYFSPAAMVGMGVGTLDVSPGALS